MTSYPLETVFMSNSSTSYRDPLKPNRIYFKFPETWANSVKQDSVIGIRDMFITKSYKHPKMKIYYSLMIRVHDSSNPEQSPGPEPIDENITVVNPNISGVISLDKYFDDETLMKEFLTKINTKFDDIDFSSTFTTSNLFTESQLNIINQTKFLSIHFEFTTDPNENHLNRLVIESDFNNLPIETRSAYNDENGIFNEYYLTFAITEMNSGAQALFGNRILTGPSEDPIYFDNIWDRNACIIYSNISEHGYLGHTRRHELNNIKYYKINGTNRNFWVELYATCDHKAPVILPQDDELFIEAQLM